MTWIARALATALVFQLISAEYVEPGPRYSCPKNRIFIHPCSCLKGSDDGLTVICENSNLASLAIGLSNLASVRLPIEYLTLSSCNVSYIFGDLLHSLAVKKLMIKDVPLQDISEDIFLAVGKWLKEIHFYRTRFTAVPSSSFAFVNELKILNIDEHQISSLSEDAFGTTLHNHLERLYVTNGNISTVQQEMFKSFKKLKTLALHHNDISQLQRNQFKGLKELELLDLSYNSISKIDSSHFGDLSKLSHLNLSYNALTDLARGAFAKNTILKVLRLSHNKLRKIDANAFRGLRLLRQLHLDDNEISHIERGTFDSISRIGTVSLAGNKITKIDYQMFNELRYVESIDVSRNLVTKIEKFAFKGLYLVTINLSHNLISTIETGAFENCANITNLDLSHNAIANFEKNAFDDITYATEFHLEFNNLTDLSQVPLANMTGLKILNVTFNKLRTIPKNTFPKLYELHTIDLSNNEIESIAPEVFQSLFGLRYLNLSRNHLAEITTRTFGKISTVLELSLRKNRIETLKKEAFVYLISVQTLDLSHNAIETIPALPNTLFHLNLSSNYISQIEPAKEWPSMNTLISLDLGRNIIGDSLQKNAFLNLLVLQWLNLANNNITEPPVDSLLDLTSLRYLNMQGNGIARLGKSAFGNLPVVFDLILDDNKIEEIEARAFVGLLQLRSLSLRNNNLTFIPNDAFFGLVALETLDISQNSVEFIDNKTTSIFEDCGSLKTLNVSHNELSFLTRNSLPSPETLRSVDFSFNRMPVLTTDFTGRAKKIRHFNFSHNIINEIREGVIENLTSLVTLDLSHNELTAVAHSSAFRLPINLTELNMSHNFLAKLPVRAMVKQRKLRVLDLRDNMLPTFSYELMKLIENGTEVLYLGNPILCNCYVRPLQRWLSSQLRVSEDWKKVTCIDYESSTNRTIFGSPEKEIFCDEITRSRNTDFEVTPDVKFREITRTKDGTLIISWYVPKNKEDIANFVLEIVNTTDSRQIFYKKNLPYYTRNEIVKPRFAITKEAEICLIATFSNGSAREIVPSQCQNLVSVLPYSISGAYAATTHRNIHFLLLAIVAILRL